MMRVWPTVTWVSPISLAVVICDVWAAQDLPRTRWEQSRAGRIKLSNRKGIADIVGRGKALHSGQDLLWRGLGGHREEG